MPEIPKRQLRIIGTPRYPMDTGQAPLAAVTQAGEQVRRLADYSQRTFDTIRQAEDRVKLLTLQNDVNREIDEMTLSFHARGDYELFESDSLKMADDLQAKYQENYGENARIWRAAGPWIEGKKNDFLQAIAARRLDLLVKDGQTQVDRTRDATARTMAEAADETERTAALAEFEETLDLMIESGIISPAEKKTQMDGLMLQAEKVEIVNALHTDNPATVRGMLARIENEGEFPTVRARQGVWLEGQKASANDRLAALDKKMIADNADAIVNGAIAQIITENSSDEGMVDFRGADKQLLDPSFQKEAGLTDPNGNPDKEMINAVRTELKAREEQQNNALDKVHDEYETKVADNFVKGEYSEVMQMLKEKDNPLTADERKTWATSVRARLDHLAETAGKLDPQAVAGAIITANMLIENSDFTPQSIKNIQRFITINPYLDTQNKEQYLNKLETAKADTITESRKLGYQAIREIIAPELSFEEITLLLKTGDTKKAAELILNTKSPDKMMLIHTAQMELDDYIDDLKEKGEPIELDAIRRQAGIIAAGKRSLLTGE